MENILLIDIGSTYTKATAVELTQAKLLGTSSALTTSVFDVNEGINIAVSKLEQKTGVKKFHKRFMCSSAAGGLKMVVCGLVPELTAKAASLASMGAGAKITGLFSYELTGDDIGKISENPPDILLLTGGTDGGNKKVILNNAKMLASVKNELSIIIAGNRTVKAEVLEILKNHNLFACENVMPRLDTLNIEPAKKMIRDIFLDRIVRAKGLNDEVLMPTPAAVLAASELLAKNIGDLIVIDVGGATTDVYSIADGAPQNPGTLVKGLPEPKNKRTVEGDIGMRFSARGIIDAVGINKISEISELAENEIEQIVDSFKNNEKMLPETHNHKMLDFALAATAIETGISRHAGVMEEAYLSSGRVLIQTGKDLSNIQNIVMTGGVLINSNKAYELTKYALFNETEPLSLRPKQSTFYFDTNYIAAAMGLLGTYAPDVAGVILNQNIRKI